MCLLTGVLFAKSKDMKTWRGLLDFWRRMMKKLRVTKAKYMIEQINMDIVICRYNTGRNIYIVWAPSRRLLF